MYCNINVHVLHLPAVILLHLAQLQNILRLLVRWPVATEELFEESFLQGIHHCQVQTYPQLVRSDGNATSRSQSGCVRGREVGETGVRTLIEQ